MYNVYTLQVTIMPCILITETRWKSAIEQIIAQVALQKTKRLKLIN